MIGYEVAVCHIFCSARIFVDGHNNRSILPNDVGRGNARKKVSKFISKDMNVGIVGIDNVGSVGVGLHPLKR